MITNTVGCLLKWRHRGGSGGIEKRHSSLFSQIGGGKQSKEYSRFWLRENTVVRGRWVSFFHYGEPTFAHSSTEIFSLKRGGVLQFSQHPEAKLQERDCLGTILSESDGRNDLLEGEEVDFGVRKPGSVPAPCSLALCHTPVMWVLSLFGTLICKDICLVDWPEDRHPFPGPCIDWGHLITLATLPHSSPAPNLLLILQEYFFFFRFRSIHSWGTPTHQTQL